MPVPEKPSEAAAKQVAEELQTAVAVVGSPGHASQGHSGVVALGSLPGAAAKHRHTEHILQRQTSLAEECIEEVVLGNPGAVGTVVAVDWVEYMRFARLCLRILQGRGVGELLEESSEKLLCSSCLGGV